jgi:hypothetical protein
MIRSFSRFKRPAPYDSMQTAGRFVFLGLCPKCERYAEVIGASPVYLLPGESTGDREIVRTDLEFASHDERSPVLLCGDAAAAALKKARLKGLVFLPEHPH